MAIRFYVNDKMVTLPEDVAKALAVVFLPKSADASGKAGISLGNVERLDMAKSLSNGESWRKMAESLTGKTLKIEEDATTESNGVTYTGITEFVMKDAGNLRVYAANVVTAIQANESNRSLATVKKVWADKPAKVTSLDANPLESFNVDSLLESLA